MSTALVQLEEGVGLGWSIIRWCFSVWLLAKFSKKVVLHVFCIPLANRSLTAVPIGWAHSEHRGWQWCSSEAVLLSGCAAHCSRWCARSGPMWGKFVLLIKHISPVWLYVLSWRLGFYCIYLHGSEILSHFLRDPRHKGKFGQQENLPSNGLLQQTIRKLTRYRKPFHFASSLPDPSSSFSCSNKLYWCHLQQNNTKTK